MKLRTSVCIIVMLTMLFYCCLINNCDGAPVSNPDSNIFEAMSQIPQWHCLRYRKFELVRRCRSFKSGLRRL